MPANDKELTPYDVADLQRCELLIRRAREAYMQAGEALYIIRARRLYRAEFDDFESYCATVWGWKDRNYADKLIRASLAAECAITDYPELPPPENEAQARELSALLDYQSAIGTTWPIVTQAANDLTGGQITSKLIRSVVETVREAVVTGTYEDGSGEQHKVSDVVRSKLTRDAYEAWQRQRDQIASKNEPPLLKAEYETTESGLVLLSDLPANTKVRVIVYPIKESHHASDTNHSS